MWQPAASRQAMEAGKRVMCANCRHQPARPAGAGCNARAHLPSLSSTAPRIGTQTRPAAPPQPHWLAAGWAGSGPAGTTGSVQAQGRACQTCCGMRGKRGGSNHRKAASWDARQLLVDKACWYGQGCPRLWVAPHMSRSRPARPPALYVEQGVGQRHGMLVPGQCVLLHRFGCQHMGQHGWQALCWRSYSQVMENVRCWGSCGSKRAVPAVLRCHTSAICPRGQRSDAKWASIWREICTSQQAAARLPSWFGRHGCLRISMRASCGVW